MSEPELLRLIDSVSNKNITYKKIQRLLQDEGYDVSLGRVWYLATFGSRSPGNRKCEGPDCENMIRKIANAKYCSIRCQKAAAKKRQEEKKQWE